jgi:tRNA nucleotidyltransferase (CCA-adding enzyme)
MQNPYRSSYKPSEEIKGTLDYKIGKDVCLKLQKQGYEAYFVGGTVRDFFISDGSSSSSVDIATNATPTDLLILFPHASLVGKQFGVVVVKVEEAFIDIATFRKESHYDNFRHPSKLDFGTLEEDVKRRDFTINALYFDPIKEEIYDPMEGLKDLKARYLKTVGSANERIYEDALRMMRAIRFMTTFSLSLDPDLLKALNDHSIYLPHLSFERILGEFKRVKLKDYVCFIQNLFTHTHFSQSMLLLPQEEIKVKKISLGTFKLADDLTSFYPVSFFYLSLLPTLKDPSSLYRLLSSWPVSSEDKGLLAYVFSLYKVFQNETPKDLRPLLVLHLFLRSARMPISLLLYVLQRINPDYSLTTLAFAFLEKPFLENIEALEGASFVKVQKSQILSYIEEKQLDPKLKSLSYLILLQEFLSQNQNQNLTKDPSFYANKAKDLLGDFNAIRSSF